MATATEVITGILVVILLMTMGFALLVGILGAVFGEGFERCASCGRITLATKGHAHPSGCPKTLERHLAHQVSGVFHDMHVRHRG